MWRSFALSASCASCSRAAATSGSSACTLGMLPRAGSASGASKNCSLGLLLGFLSLQKQAPPQQSLSESVAICHIPGGRSTLGCTAGRLGMLAHVVNALGALKKCSLRLFQRFMSLRDVMWK